MFAESLWAPKQIMKRRNGIVRVEYGGEPVWALAGEPLERPGSVGIRPVSITIPCSGIGEP